MNALYTTKKAAKRGGFVPAAVLALLFASLTVCTEARAQFLNPGFPFGYSVRPLSPRYQINGYGPSMPFFFLDGSNSSGNFAQGAGSYNGAYNQPFVPTTSDTEGIPSSGADGTNASSGKTTGNAVVNGNNVTITARGGLYGSSALPRTSDSVEATIEKDDRLFIRWYGEPRAVRRVTVALLDKDRKILKQEIITRLPVQAHLNLTAKTSYYQVVIEYVNGTSTSFTSPL